MGWNDHEDAIAYYEKGYTASLNSVTKAVRSTRKPRGKRVIRLVQDLSNLHTCAEATGRRVGEIGDVAADALLEAAGSLKFRR